VTRERIALDLRELGISPGDTVMLHASVGEIGWIVGGPDRVLAAVLDVIGEDGTLLMYVGWDGSPYDVTIGAPELPQELMAAWPAYDPETSRAVREWGVLGEYLRTWPGAERSRHPDSSFVAVGTRSGELIADHPFQYGMGPGSPLEKLCQARGKVVLLGSPLANVTLLHHAEHLADVPEKQVVRYWAPILRDGVKTWGQIEEFSTEGCLPWYGPTDMFEAILRDHVQDGHGALAHVGAAQSYVFDAADLVEYAVAWIEERFHDPAGELPDVEVRPAEPGDHRVLAALLRELEEEMTGTPIPESRALSRIDELMEGPDRCVIVAVTDRDAVGMVVASVLTPQRGALEHAFVEPPYRRRGILRELEIEATTYLRDRGCRDVELHIGAENVAAREAWASLGYTPTVQYMERAL